MVTSFRGNYYFLSNMFPHLITFNGITYRCVESAFQAQKEPSRAKEFQFLNGFEARRLGRKVNLRPDWESIKLSLMKSLLEIKFSDKTLKKQLQSTGSEKLMEGNTWGDTYWGVTPQGLGLNHLGELLMEIRKSLPKGNVIYAGIGSRSTPTHIIKLMESIGEQMALQGNILRSGGASGADSAFEQGCNKANGWKQIYLPWQGFNGNTSELVLTSVDPEELNMINKFHPNPSKLSQGALKLMARNIYQVLGHDGFTTDVIICWTPNGEYIGGTSFAMRIADAYGIKIYNLALQKDVEQLKKDFNLAI